MAISNINIRVDSEVKAQSQSLFENLGLDNRYQYFPAAGIKIGNCDYQ